MIAPHQSAITVLIRAHRCWPASPGGPVGELPPVTNQSVGERRLANGNNNIMSDNTNNLPASNAPIISTLMRCSASLASQANEIAQLAD